MTHGASSSSSASASSSSSHDDNDDDDISPRVHLGFAIPLQHHTNEEEEEEEETPSPPHPLSIGHQSHNWIHWDGGKLGGIPSWLNPRDLPTMTPLRCRLCSKKKKKKKKKCSRRTIATITTTNTVDEYDNCHCAIEEENEDESRNVETDIVEDDETNTTIQEEMVSNVRRINNDDDDDDDDNNNNNNNNNNNSNTNMDNDSDTGTILQFIAQIYCPADTTTNNPAAFHRSLYVFACPTCCSEIIAKINSNTTSTTTTTTNQLLEKNGSSRRIDTTLTTTTMMAHRLSNCIRILRCQLPQINDFYPPSSSSSSSSTTTSSQTTSQQDGSITTTLPWLLHTSEYWATTTTTTTINDPSNTKIEKRGNGGEGGRGDTSLHLCAVCGQRSQGKCPKQQLWFCGSVHQMEYSRVSKNYTQATTTTSATTASIASSSSYQRKMHRLLLPSIYPEYELVVEEEPSPSQATIVSSSSFTSNDNTTGIQTLFANNKKNNIHLNDTNYDDDDDDVHLEQFDLNAMLAAATNVEANNGTLLNGSGGVSDPITLAFYSRLSIGGKENDVKDQVLRYCQWPDRFAKEEGGIKRRVDSGMDNEKNVGVEEVEVDDDVVATNAGPLWLTSEYRPPPPPPPPSIDATMISSAATATRNDSFIFPPPCQYCGAPRSYEFQIMPQMLYYLLREDKSASAHTTITTTAPILQTTGNNNDDKKEEIFGKKKNKQQEGILTELDKAILFEGQSRIMQHGITNLPPEFIESHETAMQKARQTLLGETWNTSITAAVEKDIMDKNQTGSVEVKEGGGGNENTCGKKGCLDWGTICVYTCTASCGNGGIVSKEMGAYMEEVAWMQPPL